MRDENELIYDYFPGIVYVYDTETGQLSYVSKRISDLLGYAPGDIKSWTQMVSQDDAHLVQKELENFSLRSEETRSFQCRYTHKNDSFRYFRTQGSVLKRDDAGKPLSILFFAQDVTEQLQSVAELNRSNKELEEFAYVASHDLQEPLRKIITFSDRLLSRFSSQLGPEGIAYLSRMTVATENMRILIDNLLEFSRISRSQDAFAQTDLNEVLEGAKSELELKIEESRAVIEQGPLPSIVCNAPQIKQLFVNLLSNSLKFRHPESDTHIRIWAERPEGHQKEFVKISFADNGIGFEKEYAERIFLIFQRLHGKSEYPGSGVGLAICKKIVDQHGGVIRADSELGKGSVFTVLLPVLHMP